jgi:aspartate beta-hydroxylase
MISSTTPLATIFQSAMCRTRVRHRPWPSLFFFPGLATKPIWHHQDQNIHAQDILNNKNHFRFLNELEASYNDILKEYYNLKSLEMKSDYGGDDKKLHKGQWDWLSYVQKGSRQSNFAVHCPRTVELLESFSNPSLMLNTPFSFAFFSTMYPNSTIAAHTSPVNLRVRCHFPLIIPKEGDCGIRVADHVVRWKEGKAFLFDDSFEHEGKRLLLFLLLPLKI